MDGDEKLQAAYERGYTAGVTAERERIRKLAEQHEAIYDGNPAAIAPQYEEFASLLYDDAATAGT